MPHDSVIVLAMNSLYPSSGHLRRSSYVAVALIFLGFTTPGSALPDPGRPLEGSAVVVDGDTIEINGERVRLEGIDAPEVAQTCSKDTGEPWDCGLEASEVLRALISSKSVSCDRVGQDKYGRTLGLCFADADELNAAMVRTGYAWAFIKYSQAYVIAEKEAQALRAGIWQGTAIPAWEFRHRPDRVADASAPAGCLIKGNVSKKGQIYHTQASAWYGKVKVDESRGERWFCSEGEAVAAGWRAAENP